MLLGFGTEIVARFKLHMRCENCLRETARVVAVPDAENAPRDIDDLVGSEFLRRLPFECSRCGSAIAALVAVTNPGLEN